MPWKLITPISVGDLDDNDYGEIKLIRFSHDSISRVIDLAIEYGNTGKSGEWVSGVLPYGKKSVFTVSKSQYSNLIIGQLPQISTVDPMSQNYVKIGSIWVERTYVAVKRGVYEWLFNNGYIRAGVLI